MTMRRYDVFIENDTSTHDEKLVLLQFPSLKSPLDNQSDQLHLSVKSKSLKLKLDLDLNQHSKDFSASKAELLSEKSKPQIFPNRLVDKNIYSSTKNNIDDSQVLVCIAVGDKLVCRPISNVLTFRSDLTHFDLKDEVDPREEVKPVSVKFAPTDRHSAPIKPKETQQEIEESIEDYKSFKLSGRDSDEAKSQREYLFGIPSCDVKIKPDPDGPMECDQKPVIDETCLDVKPKIERLEIEDIYSAEYKNQPGSPRKSNIIKTRVKECLIKAKLVSFEEVYQYLREYRDFSSQKLHGNQIIINIKDMIDALNEYAVLVQGNWAVKSEILYGDSTVRDTTDVTGIPINLFVAARDYLLWLFNQERLVSRPDYTKQVKIPDHDALELFNQLGIFHKKLRKWELKLPTDQRFLEKFSDVANRQNTLWRVTKSNKFNVFLRA